MEPTDDELTDVSRLLQFVACDEMVARFEGVVQVGVAVLRPDLDAPLPVVRGVAVRLSQLVLVIVIPPAELQFRGGPAMHERRAIVRFYGQQARRRQLRDERPQIERRGGRSAVLSSSRSR